MKSKFRISANHAGDNCTIEIRIREQTQNHRCPANRRARAPASFFYSSSGGCCPPFSSSFHLFERR
jgi:hypothetical protein